MKSTIIIYGSKYGSTKLYAEQLSAITGIKCVSYKEAEGISTSLVSLPDPRYQMPANPLHVFQIPVQFPL